MKNIALILATLILATLTTNSAHAGDKSDPVKSAVTALARVRTDLTTRVTELETQRATVYAELDDTVVECEQTRVAWQGAYVSHIEAQGVLAKLATIPESKDGTVTEIIRVALDEATANTAVHMAGMELAIEDASQIGTRQGLLITKVQELTAAIDEARSVIASLQYDIDRLNGVDSQSSTTWADELRMRYLSDTMSERTSVVRRRSSSILPEEIERCLLRDVNYNSTPTPPDDELDSPAPPAGFGDLQEPIRIGGWK